MALSHSLLQLLTYLSRGATDASEISNGRSDGDGLSGRNGRRECRGEGAGRERLRVLEDSFNKHLRGTCSYNQRMPDE